MGGSSSTRWERRHTRHYTSECLNLDLRRFMPLFRQIPVGFVWRWTSNRGKESSVGVSLPSRERMIVEYAVTQGQSPPMTMRVTVPLTWTPCNYGGERPWFRCPACDRRVLVIYAPPGGRTFRCRHCHDLAYVSQQSSPHDRLLLRIRNIQRRLGGDPAHLSPWQAPPIPKGMRWRTYRRLVEEMSRCERERDVYLRIGFNRLMKRSDRVLRRYRNETENTRG
jgi:hypothetical protein